MKPLLLALCLLAPVAAFADSTPRSTTPDHQSELRPDLLQNLLSPEAQNGATLYLAACCKVCRKGKACGNSCISRDKACHQPPGCACDG